MFKNWNALDFICCDDNRPDVGFVVEHLFFFLGELKLTWLSSKDGMLSYGVGISQMFSLKACLVFVLTQPATST